MGGCVIATGIVALAAAMAFVATSEETDEHLGAVAAVALALAYTSTEIWLAGTPGKLLTGIRIGTAAGTVAGRWALLLRWSTKHYGWLIALVEVIVLGAEKHPLSGWMNTIVMIGCLQALDEHRRTWHDEWAGTAVYRSADLRPTPGPGAATPPPFPPLAA
jgi:hypothetical protein